MGGTMPTGLRSFHERSELVEDWERRVGERRWGEGVKEVKLRGEGGGGRGERERGRVSILRHVEQGWNPEDGKATPPHWGPQNDYSGVKNLSSVSP